MRKQRVLLVSSHHLFGESVETVLRQAMDVELLEPLDMMQQDICLQLPVLRPDAVVIVDELPDTLAVSLLTAEILQQFPNLPVFRADLSENIFHVFAAHTLPARGSDLVEALTALPANGPWEAGEQNPGSDPLGGADDEK
jgi:DNA-binding NarL/FixJ family response regulator